MPRTKAGLLGVFGAGREHGGSRLGARIAGLRSLGGKNLGQAFEILGFRTRGGQILCLDGFVDLFAVNRDIFWGIDPEFDMFPFDINNRDDDIVANNDAFIPFAAQY